MKKVICILLLFAFLLQYFSKVELLVYYAVNKQQIVELFCINKDRPALHCDGKCYMKKQWNAREEGEKKAPLNLKKTHQVVLFFEEQTAGNIQPKSSTVAPRTNIKCKEHHIPGKGIFHPPQIA